MKPPGHRPEGSTTMYADLVIKSNAVFTGDGTQPFKGGVAIKGDKILTCGDELHLAPFVGPETEVREYGDQFVMPGFIDSHTHLAQGAFMTDPDFCVNLIDCNSFEQCMERVVAFADAHPDNEWVLGVQVIQFQWDVPEMPTAVMISWPLHSLQASGANIHLGSDFPVVGIEPMEEVYGAVFRMLEDGSNAPGWFPEERITMADALRAYTYGSAYAMGVEDRFGTLAAGKVADVCVLDHNLFTCTPAEVLETKSLLTVMGGKVVYEA